MPFSCNGPPKFTIAFGLPPDAGRVKIPANPLLMNSVDPSGETAKSSGPELPVPKGGPEARSVAAPPVTGRLNIAPATLSAIYNVDPSGETATPWGPRKGAPEAMTVGVPPVDGKLMIEAID